MTSRGGSEEGPYCVVVSFARPGEEGTGSMDKVQMLSFRITFLLCNSCIDLIINYNWQINALVPDPRTCARTRLVPLGGYFYPFLIVD